MKVNLSRPGGTVPAGLTSSELHAGVLVLLRPSPLPPGPQPSLRSTMLPSLGGEVKRTHLVGVLVVSVLKTLPVEHREHRVLAIVLLKSL